MDRVNGADWIDIGGGKRGFRNENEGAGVSGTELTALWLNDVQENLAKVIEGAGLALAAGDWTLLDKAIRRIAGLSGLANIPVDSYVSSPPGAPAEGAQHLIAANPTGLWLGKAGQIARWISGEWQYETPRAGRIVTYWSGIRLVTLRFDGAAWAEWQASATAAGPVELATVAETVAGADAGRAVTPEADAQALQRQKPTYAVAAGTANAIILTLDPAPASLGDLVGAPFRFRVVATNTGPVTLNLNTFGVLPIVRAGGLALKANELPAGAIATVIYDAVTGFQLQALSTSTLPPPPDSVTFNGVGNFNWACPAGVFFVDVEVWGGGGGGAGSAPAPASNAENYAGEGGAGGGYARGTYAVVPGQTYSGTVGGGGPAGPGGGDAGSGATSGFAGKISATGGQGGRVASVSGGSPATLGREGGYGVGGQVNLSGGPGNVVSKSGTQSYPGAGGPAPLGGQGAISSSTAPSAAGSPGGGGGGSGGAGVIPGSPGAPGRVIIRY